MKILHYPRLSIIIITKNIMGLILQQHSKTSEAVLKEGLAQPYINLFNLYHLFYPNCFYCTQVLGESNGDDGGDDGGNGGGAINLKAFDLGVVLCVATIVSSF